jgi:epoxyqueuosine reductase
MDLTGLQTTAARLGLHAIGVVPLVDLGGVLEHTLEALRSGRIPPQYGWTEDKTRRACRYKGYNSWAGSIIVAAESYHTGEEYPPGRSFGRIAPYTWRNSYQHLMDKLSNLVEALEKSAGRSIAHRVHSNYTSIPEKPLFAYSGLGSVGKNCLLISPGLGSRFVIGEAFIDLQIESAAQSSQAAGIAAGNNQATGGAAGRRPSAPDFGVCGPCTACMEACPTGALTGPGVLNVNRCIQFISENLVEVPDDIREVWGNRLYGCSTCADVCPVNRDLEPRGERHKKGHVGTGMELVEVLESSDERLVRLFRGNQLEKRRIEAVRRNAILACGSGELRGTLPLVRRYSAHPHPLVGETARWAAARLEG